MAQHTFSSLQMAFAPLVLDLAAVPAVGMIIASESLLYVYSC